MLHVCVLEYKDDAVVVDTKSQGQNEQFKPDVS